MNDKTIIAFLLMTVALFQSPTMAAAVASQGHVDNGLREWLAPISDLDKNRSVTTMNDPFLPVARFYKKVCFQPVWTIPDQLLPQGEFLLQTIANAAKVGLFSADYRPHYLEATLAHGVSFSDQRVLKNLAPHIQFDVMLTDGILRYAQHLSQGRVMPETLPRQWLAQRRPSTRDIPAELADALNESRLKAYIESLHPKAQAYGELRKILQQYEQIKQSGGWPAIAPGPPLRKGDRGIRVEALTRRLQTTDDWPSGIRVAYSGYDEIVEAAVKRFQHRHGLLADGIVGKRTQTELNIPIEKRITQLRLNMERWRWFPDNLGDRYLMVNIPAFELSVVEANTTIDSMRAIVGKKGRQTPIMSSRMTYLDFNPYWNIPRKIVRKDILPKVINDPEYLTRQGIRVFGSWDPQAREMDPTNIPWENLSPRHFPFRLRQDPSDTNALGRVKFMFPNHQSVYIHDSPDKSLFNRQKRSFSSGCVRVETPMALAQYLLNNQGWDRTRLETTIANGQRRTVLLDHPIPVHLVYFTAWVDADGTVNFREDIYERDRELLIALNTRDFNLILCSTDAVRNNQIAVCAPLPPDPNATAAASGRVVSAIESTDSVADNQMTGL